MGPLGSVCCSLTRLFWLRGPSAVWRVYFPQTGVLLHKQCKQQNQDISIDPSLPSNPQTPFKFPICPNNILHCTGIQFLALSLDPCSGKWFLSVEWYLEAKFSVVYVLVAGGVSLLSGKRSEWPEVGMHRHMYVYEHTNLYVSLCLYWNPWVYTVSNFGSSNNHTKTYWDKT